MCLSLIVKSIQLLKHTFFVILSYIKPAYSFDPQLSCHYKEVIAALLLLGFAKSADLTSFALSFTSLGISIGST